MSKTPSTRLKRGEVRRTCTICTQPFITSEDDHASTCFGCLDPLEIVTAAKLDAAFDLGSHPVWGSGFAWAARIERRLKERAL